MKENLNKILFLTLAIFIVIIIVFAFLIYNGGKAMEANIGMQMNEAMAVKEVDEFKLDDDRDGLNNWEERQYGTDPKHEDTDRDGYLDIQEIKTGHDPLKDQSGEIVDNNEYIDVSGVERNSAKFRDTRIQANEVSDLCEQWEERQASRGDIKSSEGVDLPTDFQRKMGGQNNLMAEICEDGKVTEEEEKELEEMKNNSQGFKR